MKVTDRRKAKDVKLKILLFSNHPFLLLFDSEDQSYGTCWEVKRDKLMSHAEITQYGLGSNWAGRDQVNIIKFYNHHMLLITSRN